MLQNNEEYSLLMPFIFNTCGGLQLLAEDAAVTYQQHHLDYWKIK